MTDSHKRRHFNNNNNNNNNFNFEASLNDVSIRITAKEIDKREEKP